MSTGAGKLDEFESLFRSALHEVFHLERPELSRVLVVSDRSAEEGAALRDRVASFLSGIDGASAITFDVVDRAAWADKATPIPALLTRIEAAGPDLVVSERHLLGAVRDLPHTLGSVVDTLTQAQPVPVLLLPVDSELPEGTRTVLAVTDHMTGNDSLVSWAVRVARPDGTLVLAHIEDDTTVERYLQVITRIRDLDSDVARAKIPTKLLDMPREYLASIQGVLAGEGITQTIAPVVRMGHALSDYRALVDEHDVDLIVVDTKDDRQRAMHGLAHALAVELRHRPMLLL